MGILVVGDISRLFLIGPFSETSGPRGLKFCMQVDLDIQFVSKYYADSPSPIGEPLQLPKGRKMLFFWKS